MLVEEPPECEICSSRQVQLWFIGGWQSGTDLAWPMKPSNFTQLSSGPVILSCLFFFLKYFMEYHWVLNCQVSLPEHKCEPRCASKEFPFLVSKMGGMCLQKLPFLPTRPETWLLWSCFWMSLMPSVPCSTRIDRWNWLSNRWNYYKIIDIDPPQLILP